MQGGARKRAAFSAAAPPSRPPLTPRHSIKTGFVPNMRVPCMFYVNAHLQALMFEELEVRAQPRALFTPHAACLDQQYVQRGDVGGFLPAVKQLANVAALPGIVKASIALPDVHSGYGFAIGNVAAFDMADPEAIVSPGARPSCTASPSNLTFSIFYPPSRDASRRRRLRHQLRRAAAAHQPGGG